MNGITTKKKGWIWLGVLLVLFAICSYLVLSQKQEEFSPYDSESPSPTGLKAFYSYLQNEVEMVNRWEKPPNLLPDKERRQVLLMVEPYFTPDTKTMESYIDFLEKGNTILLFKNNPKGYFDIRTTFVDSMFPEQTINDASQTNFVGDIHSPVRIEPAVEDEILFSDPLGDVSVKRKYGDGTLIVALTPHWLTNQEILKKDHLPLVLSLIQEEGLNNDTIILFDEYNHGETGTSSIDVYQDWFLLLLFQGMLVAILLLWNQGKRFGPILQPREETVRYSDESLRALAAWYLKGNAYQDSLSNQAEYVKYLLQERWGIPYNRDWKECAVFLHKRWKTKEDEKIDLFTYQLTQVLAKEKITKQEYLEWSKQLDTLRKEVEEG
ncbi:DUF4350 domain-containing protein [Sutcliffiella horikoshii]|uniref:DUF4350 domain-containing protein n=1 Tax=Sutcliffiella horikoshii TaxID=79883 RepID=A0A5D4T4Z9_9BACI|nr:DUF4350 domain-containing protein [Sutcliffiella horikoshii]TYS70369.1 DUF4350 domain-containing protein [Sutcliffiella horikoshii]